MCLSSNAESKTGLKKIKISANPNNFITKILIHTLCVFVYFKFKKAILKHLKI